MSAVSRGRKKWRTGDVVGTNVNDDATRLEPLALDELGLADRGDDDVGVLELGGISAIVG
jgi:hypothetical protein